MIWKPKYKTWWNDKEGIEAQKKYGTPIVILSALFFYLTIFDKVSLVEYFMMIGSLYIFIYSFLDYILKLPNGFIDEAKESEKTKSNIRFYLFIMGVTLSYLISIPILAKYYPFFEQFVGAQFLIKHFGF